MEFIPFDIYEQKNDKEKQALRVSNRTATSLAAVPTKRQGQDPIGDAGMEMATMLVVPAIIFPDISTNE